METMEVSIFLLPIARGDAKVVGQTKQDWITGTATF